MGQQQTFQAVAWESACAWPLVPWNKPGLASQRPHGVKYGLSEIILNQAIAREPPNI